MVYASEYLIWTVRLGGFSFHLHLNTLIYTWLIMIIMILPVIWMRNRWQLIPKPLSLQNLIETIYDFTYQLSESVMSEKMAQRYTPLIFTFFTFILLSNWFGIIPDILPHKVQPTSDYSTTLALALISVIGYNLISIREQGFSHWLKHLIHPIPSLMKERNLIVRLLIPVLLLLFLTLNLMEIFARGLSLSVRLFGNIFGEHTVSLTLVSFSAAFKPMSLIIFSILVFVSAIGLLAGFVQALIFATLTASYIGTSVEEEK